MKKLGTILMATAFMFAVAPASYAFTNDGNAEVVYAKKKACKAGYTYSKEMKKCVKKKAKK